MGFDNPKQVLDFLHTMADADSGRRNEMERTAAMAVSYYGGLQYRRAVPRTADFRGGIARLPTDNDPDSNKLRMTRNRTSKFVQKVAVASFPEDLEITCQPPDRSLGMEGLVRAQLFQDAINDVCVAGGYLECRRDDNFQRAVWGSYGIGIRLRCASRKLNVYGGEQQFADIDQEFFTWSPIEVTLDPYCRDRLLSRHDWVIHHTVMTLVQARRWLGDAADLIDEKRCKTLGDLAPFYRFMNRISDGQLFAQYQSNSQTKGVVVHQLHHKDDTGRHALMFTVLDANGEDANKEKSVINFDNPESPFGGGGLPLAWYHAHRRTDGPVGLSDAAMMKDDQDVLNITSTAAMRQQLRSAGWQWMMDRRTIKGKSDEAVQNMLANVTGGSIIYDAGTKDDPHQPPQLVKYPQVDSMLMEFARSCEDSMREQSHRAEVNEGVAKTHQSNALMQSAIEQSDQVLGARTVEDKVPDLEILSCALGTLIKQVQSMSPCTIQRLQAMEFSDDDLAMLFGSDPISLNGIDLDCNIHRYRSPNARRAELKEAATAAVPLISPDKYRRSMVELDMAVDDEDKFYQRRCDQIALGVMRGEPFQPLLLGEWNGWILASLRRALMEAVGSKDPQARQRVELAIQSQEMAAAQQAALAASGGAGQAPQPQGAGSVGDQSFEQVMAGLGAGAQPVAA